MEKEGVVRGFIFQKADWDKFRGQFRGQLAARLGDIVSEGSTEEWSTSFYGVVRKATEKAIQIKGERKGRKIVPWCNQACNNAVRGWCFFRYREGL